LGPPSLFQAIGGVARDALLRRRGQRGECRPHVARGARIGGLDGEAARGAMHGRADRLHALRHVFRHVVRAVHWRRGAVELAGTSGGRAFRVRARAAVITAPVGVLKHPGALRFDPVPDGLKRALAGLGMGAATRLVFAFDRPAWNETRALAGREAGFLHVGNGGPFPVWWTALPERAPMLVAWTGGPAADAIAAQPIALQRKVALRGLARALGTTAAKLEGAVTGAWTHDWQRDPYARGAYSYTRVGGANAARTLARGIEGTLFIAGEATVSEGSGTVEGALASGQRAARQVLRSLTGE